MREDGEEGGAPQRVRAVGGAWWRTRWFYLVSQAALGVLLIPLFGSLVLPAVPYLIAPLAISSVLLIPIVLIPKLNATLNKRSLALMEREQAVRRDLRDKKALLVSVSEILAPFLPHYLKTVWRINYFEHRRGYSSVDLQPDPFVAGGRIKLILSFSGGVPVVEGLCRYDETTDQWPLLFGSDSMMGKKTGKRKSGLTPEELPSLLVALWFLPVFMLGVCAPCRALMLLVHRFLQQVPGGMGIAYPVNSLFGMALLPGHLDLLAGICGVAFGVLGIYRVGFWQLRLARQMKNIPTATARSAAAGLAEFRGIARGRKTILYFSTGDTADSTTQMLAPFELDDGTGTIRIDPQGAAMRSFWSLQFLQRLGGSVVLTKRVTPRAYGRKEVRELRYGDPVYVLGNVEKDPEAATDAEDSGRLVVRRSRRHVRLPLLYRLLKVARSSEQFTYLDVFFISDTTEQRAYHWLMADLRKTVVVAVAWIALSSWLLWQGGQAVKAW